MKGLKERILKDGKCFPGGILKVDSFINHQMDASLMRSIIAAMLVMLGMFPYVGLVFSLMPEPVLGGATLLMFGTVAAAGVRILASQSIDRKASLVIAISMAFGVGVEMVPDILACMPQTIREIFSSGITTGSVAAILSNMLIRIKNES